MRDASKLKDKSLNVINYTKRAARSRQKFSRKRKLKSHNKLTGVKREVMKFLCLEIHYIEFQ